MKKIIGDAVTCDINFSLQGIMVPAHKAILCARSEYFQAMFGGNMLEATSQVIELDVTYNCFFKGLEFIYTGTISNIDEIDSDMVIELMELVTGKFLENSYKFYSLWRRAF